MKKTFGKLSYLATYTLLLFAFTSCSDKEDELFDSPSVQSRQENIKTNNADEEFVLLEDNLGLFTGMVIVRQLDSETGICFDLIYDNKTDLGKKLFNATFKAYEEAIQKTETSLSGKKITDNYSTYSDWYKKEIENNRIVVTSYKKETGQYIGISFSREEYKETFACNIPCVSDCFLSGI